MKLELSTADINGMLKIADLGPSERLPLNQDYRPQSPLEQEILDQLKKIQSRLTQVGMGEAGESLNNRHLVFAYWITSKGVESCVIYKGENATLLLGDDLTENEVLSLLGFMTKNTIVDPSMAYEFKAEDVEKVFQKLNDPNLDLKLREILTATDSTPEMPVKLRTTSVKMSLLATLYRKDAIFFFKDKRIYAIRNYTKPSQYALIFFLLKGILPANISPIKYYSAVISLSENDFFKILTIDDLPKEWDLGL